MVATSGWHEANAREAEPGAHDCSHGAADVEGREGVRPRASEPVSRNTRRLGKDSLRRVVEGTATRSRSGEERSHATLGVAAEVSIHVCPGPRPTAWRSEG